MIGSSCIDSDLVRHISESPAVAEGAPNTVVSDLKEKEDLPREGGDGEEQPEEGEEAVAEDEKRISGDGNVQTAVVGVPIDVMACCIMWHSSVGYYAMLSIRITTSCIYTQNQLYLM